MVNIDTVYQTVLALANKEQRGYITPQEFNLFAEHSQLEIISNKSRGAVNHYGYSSQPIHSSCHVI